MLALGSFLAAIVLLLLTLETDRPRGEAQKRRAPLTQVPAVSQGPSQI
jgi:hypothetical protein